MPSTVLRGAQERLIPILMTAAVTALGLMPLALGMNQPGQEIEGPMAVTVLGGLITSTLLNLVVLPALAERFGGPRKAKRMRTLASIAACALLLSGLQQHADAQAAGRRCSRRLRTGRRCGNAPIWPSPDWWQGFGDPQLASSDSQAQADNLDIAQAAARLRQADARARQAGAALLPSLGLNAGINSLYGQSGGVSQHETDYSAALGASYELDFWGKNRDAAEFRRTARATPALADRATVALTVDRKRRRTLISSFCRCGSGWRWRGPISNPRKTF